MSAGHSRGGGRHRRDRDTPAALFSPTRPMGLHLIEGCPEGWPEKVRQVGTICAYPEIYPRPLQRTDVWDGYPKKPTPPTAWPRKALLVMCQAYRQQYGLTPSTCSRSISTAPTTTSISKRRTSFPRLIRKCVEARDRGDQHITAGAPALPAANSSTSKTVPGAWSPPGKIRFPRAMNLGSGRRSDQNLTELVARLAKFKHDRLGCHQADGQPRRCLDVTRAKENDRLCRRNLAGRRFWPARSSGSKPPPADSR